MLPSMTFDIALTLAAIALLLMLSAFFNLSETALTAASRARMHALAEEDNSRAKLVNLLLASPEKMIGAVLLGNTLVDVMAASLATSLGLEVFGPAGVVYATGIVTVMIVIFSAVLPKTFAMASADSAALAVAPIMRGIIWLLTPATVALQFVVRWLLKLTPSKVDDKANILAAHEELRGTIELSTKDGAVARGDANMLGGVLDLRDLQVLDIMVHRTKMETVNADDPPAKIISDVLKSQYTRVPLWKDEPENIVGLLHTKDLLSALDRSGWDASKLEVMSFATQPWFVPDTTGVKAQLNQFLKRKSQLALVVDEYGEVQGLITLEDILEEIVGQISDEHDGSETAIRPQADGTVNVDGSVPIRDLNRQMNWDLPDEEATTVAGLVIHEAQTIPEPGQTFTFHGYRFEILRKSRNKITALRVTPVGAAMPAKLNAAGRAKDKAASGGETDPMNSG
jgi:Mg2+/Co2+ transporter CorB